MIGETILRVFSEEALLLVFSRRLPLCLSVRCRVGYASAIRVTGNKAQQRLYYRHSTYPGGLKSVALGDLLARQPERVIKHTVKGMLPRNTLGKQMLRKLKVYAGPTHPHAAQFRASDKQKQRTTEEQTV